MLRSILAGLPPQNLHKSDNRFSVYASKPTHMLESSLRCCFCCWRDVVLCIPLRDVVLCIPLRDVVLCIPLRPNLRLWLRPDLRRLWRPDLRRLELRLGCESRLRYGLDSRLKRRSRFDTRFTSRWWSRLCFVIQRADLSSSCRLWLRCSRRFLWCAICLRLLSRLAVVPL